MSREFLRAHNGSGIARGEFRFDRSVRGARRVVFKWPQAAGTTVYLGRYYVTCRATYKRDSRL